MISVKEFRMATFSNQYYQFIDEFAKTDYESSKLLGKFYTAYEVADEMIDRVVSSISLKKFGDTISVIDPFCGDGRLVISLLKKLTSLNCNKKIQIKIWDIDSIALDNAKQKIQEFLLQTDLVCELDAEVTDTFVAYFEVAGEFDVCVTNPPWGLLKPQKLFNSRCSEMELDEYKTAIAMYDDYMKQEFNISLPTSKFGKWGTNLGRCGLEVALRLVSPDGVCGFVSPASLFNDQVSVPFRKWIFKNFCINSVAYFPAELKLYGSADVSSITVIVTPGATHNFYAKIYNSEFHYMEKDFDEHEVEVIEFNDYAIPLEFGIEAMRLQAQLKKCITLEQYCRNRNLFFVRELDETRVAEKLMSKGKIVFAKGYMVDRYKFSPEELYLNEEKVIPPRSVDFHKVVWRDVSRNSQKRRIKATIIDSKCIAGNSLGAIYSGNDDVCELKMVLAILNSYVFESQARQKLVSNHVSVGILKKMKIPDIVCDECVVQIVTDCLNGIERQNELEIKIAKLYNLDFDEFFDMLKSFEIDKEEVEAMKNAWDSIN